MLHVYDAPDDGSAYLLEAQLDADNLVVVASDHGTGLRGYAAGHGMTLIKQAADRVLLTSPACGGARVEMHFALPSSRLDTNVPEVVGMVPDAEHPDEPVNSL